MADINLDGMALYAKNAYGASEQNLGTKSIANNVKDQVAGAEKFQNAVRAEFNKFANMTQSEIQNYMRSAKVNASSNMSNYASRNLNADSISGVQQVLGSMKNVLKKNEKISGDALFGKASIQDILYNSTEAKNLLNTIVKTRDKMLEAWDKVMNMQF